jgi:hypothetical protein
MTQSTHPVGGLFFSMKTLALYTSITCILTAVAQAQSQDVTWQTPVAISGASDVNTQGTFYGSWAPYDGSANSMSVNGVVFQGYASPPGFSANFPQSDQGGYNDYQSPGTANTNYNDLLQYATYAQSGSGTIVISWDDTPGHTYLIQAWANDGRGNGRTETFTGGANTSAALDFGDAPGQYIIGTYVADSSGTETITLSGAGSPNGDYPQINLLQIRDISTNVVTNYQSAVLAANPLAYYALNPASDPSGASPDLTGNGNNGAANAITPATGPSPYLTNAANFISGNYSFIDLSEASRPTLLDFSGPITLEAWVQPASSSEFADIIGKGYDSSSYDEIFMRVNGPYGAVYSASSGSVTESGGPQETNWTYVVLSSDGVNCSLYVNAGLVAQSSDPNGAINFSDDWVIGDGSEDGNNRLFNGNISQVAIYNYGLNVSQIQSHYYFGMAGTNNLNYAVPIITNQPQAQSVYPGSSATFTVGALSVLPVTNQWYTNGVAIPGQTNATLTLSNVQSNNAATYSVVVGNNNGTSISVSVPLNVLPPGVLEWSANANTGVWDTGSSPNWLDLANNTQTVFNTGNQVLFDDTVGVPTSVTVSGSVSPGTLTVDSSTNNFTISSGTFTGSGNLIKEGSSVLTIDTVGFTGPVTIGGGAIYAGNNCFGSVSSITVSNNATLDLAGGTLSGDKPVTVSGTGLNGEGAVFNSYPDYPQEGMDIILAGDAKLGGSARWDMASGAEITGAGNVTVDWSAGAGYGQWNTITIGSNIPSVTVTNGSSLGFSYMDSSCQNPATLFSIASGCQLTFYNGGFNGSIGTAGQVTIYNGTFGGSTFNVLSGGVVMDYNSGTTFSTGTVHVSTGATFYLYSSDINFTGSSLILDNNAQWVTYYNSGSNVIDNAVTFTGVAHMVLGDHQMVYTNVLSGAGGFVLDYYNNQMVLSASNTYQGPTIIGDNGNNPEVVLTGNGSISQSSLIFFGGTNATQLHVDASGRSDGTLTLASGQTLGGIGAVNGSLTVSAGATIAPAGTNTTIGITTGSNPTGALTASGAISLGGTTMLKLGASGVNDVIGSASSIHYGGTLSLVNITGGSLTAGSSYQIFSGASYAGSFSSITPTTPGANLAWDTSQLNSGGILNVVAVPQFGITSVSISAGNIVLSGANGSANTTYYLLTTTNISTPLTNWTTIATNMTSGTGTFSITNALTPGAKQQFFTVSEQ